MANWQSIDELQDIASDLPRFTHALDELSRRLGLDITPLTADHISLRCHQNATAVRWRRGCVAIKTPPLCAGVAGLNSAASFCQKI